MRILTGNDEDSAINYLRKAAIAAQESTCQRSQCGSIIVRDDRIIGVGFNSPPGEREDQRRCKCEKTSLDSKVTDKTCCVHAEQRAIIDALKRHPLIIPNSTLYFARLEQGTRISKSGKPYCTICSKMALDVGIAEFVLWHEEGITAYETSEYNLLSFCYKSNSAEKLK